MTADHFQKRKEIEEYISLLPEKQQNLARIRADQITAYYASGNFLQKTVLEIIQKEFKLDNLSE